MLQIQNNDVNSELLFTQENHRRDSAVSYEPLHPLECANEDSEEPSLDPKYLSQSFHEEEPVTWSHFPEDMQFHQG